METLSLFEKPPTKAKRVETALKSAGLGGVSNSTLNEITYRYSSVIFNLRTSGHKIVTGPTDKHGHTIYYWHW